MKAFSKQLHREKANELQALSARWFNAHRRSFARVVLNLFDTQIAQKSFAMENVLKKPVDKSVLIESFLSQFNEELELLIWTVEVMI